MRRLFIERLLIARAPPPRDNWPPPAVAAGARFSPAAAIKLEGAAADAARQLGRTNCAPERRTAGDKAPPPPPRFIKHQADAERNKWTRAKWTGRLWQRRRRRPKRKLRASWVASGESRRAQQMAVAPAKAERHSS